MTALQDFHPAVARWFDAPRLSSAAWNAGDATAYAAGFTQDATYVVFDGTILRGRREIEDSHRWLFDGPLSGSTVDFAAGGTGPEIRYVSPGVAHVHAVGEPREKPEGRSISVRARLRARVPATETA